LSATKYFTKLRVIWDELENFNPNTLCFCKVGFLTADAKTSKFSSTRKICTFCNCTGAVETCYKKHDFPLGYKFTNRPPQVHNMVTTNDISLEPLSKEQDTKDIHLTSQQCQFLTDILR